MIHLVIIGSVRLYREGLAEALRSCADLDVVGTWDCDLSVVAELARSAPHVVLIDVASPESVAVVQALRRAARDTALVAFAVNEDERDQNVVRLAQANVRGWVTTGQSIAELVETVKRVAIGETVYPPTLISTLLHELRTHGRSTPLPAVTAVLTSREQQILDLIARHLSNKEIGNMLNISEATVKSHVHHVLEKLKVSRRSQAAASFAFANARRA